MSDDDNIVLNVTHVSPIPYPSNNHSTWSAGNVIQQIKKNGHQFVNKRGNKKPACC